MVYCTSANTIIVDINGGGQYTSINAAIGVANSNDTVKVWPGTYLEQVTLNKNIVLMGSGYENTIITGNFSPSITVSSGKLQWFRVTSLTGIGIMISGGTVNNCVIMGCANVGIQSNSGTGTITNCVIWNNGSYGIYAKSPGYLTVYNCISRNNTGAGFYGDSNYGCFNRMTLSYSNGSRSCTVGNQGCIDSDPMFASSLDFHISEGSPCWNTGNPSLYDPDGSISDMGYFGGPDCPIYPVVTEIIITPSGNTINLQAKGRANY
ncbi:MAG: pectinesterase family protein [Bacteroidota bacterium]|nr:pectinesterase family protein [Bacteroidota bacterium]